MPNSRKFIQSRRLEIELSQEFFKIARFIVLVAGWGYTGHIARRCVDQSKWERIPWISGAKMGRREDSFMAE